MGVGRCGRRLWRGSTQSPPTGGWTSWRVLTRPRPVYNNIWGEIGDRHVTAPSSRRRRVVPHTHFWVCGTVQLERCIKNIHEFCQQTMRKCEMLSRENAMSSTMLSRKVDIASDLCNLIESFGAFYRQWKYICKDKQRVLYRSLRAPALLSKL